MSARNIAFARNIHRPSTVYVKTVQNKYVMDFDEKGPQGRNFFTAESRLCIMYHILEYLDGFVSYKQLFTIH